MNLITGEHGVLPEDVAFESAERTGVDWVVTFRAEWDEEEPMYQIFGHTFFDAEDNTYDINTRITLQGDPDQEGNITYFLDEFSLEDYPYDEVWLSPHYSHNWVAEDLIVITVQ